MELSHARPVAENNPRPLGKPETLPGVGSSDLVRRPKDHGQFRCSYSQCPQ